ncbi:MAG: dienelactone hydrolase family protein [Oligoflexales bacterium]
MKNLKTSNLRVLLHPTIILSLCLSHCQTPQVDIPTSSIHAHNWKQVEQRVLHQNLHIDEFSKKGPFKVKTHRQVSLSISPKEKFYGDYFRPSHKGKAPLIIFIHGNLFNRHAHSHQASRLSSWGFHTLILDVPNQHEWVENGKRVAKVTKLIQSYPQQLSSHIDTQKIILIGHSFGGSAVTLAAAHGAPVHGLILLDPAVVHDIVIKAMNKVAVPVVLLGADPSVFRSRRRQLFFKHIPTAMTEVTVAGSTHNDAQYPSITSWRWGVDPFTTTQYQETFLRSIIVASFGLSHHNLRYIWSVVRQAEKEKKGLKNTKIRFTQDKQKRLFKKKHPKQVKHHVSHVRDFRG